MCMGVHMGVFTVPLEGGLVWDLSYADPARVGCLCLPPPEPGQSSLGAGSDIYQLESCGG